MKPKVGSARPLHPMVVHFPLALLALSTVADLAFFFLKIESLRHTGWWSLAGAAVGAALAVAAGLFDMRRASLNEAVHARVHRHMKVGLVLLAAIAALTFWRWTVFLDTSADVSAIYLDCAIVVMALALFQGWLGGELVYSDGVFVSHEEPRAGVKPQVPSKGKGGHHH